MADPRATPSAVRDILETSLKDPQIRAFIQDANLWITEELASAGLSDDRLELIERYLACALIRMRDLGLKSSSMKDVTEQYQVDPVVTEYLTRAAAFDPTGRLKRAFMSQESRATFRVGKLFTDCP